VPRGLTRKAVGFLITTSVTSERCGRAAVASYRSLEFSRCTHMTAHLRTKLPWAVGRFVTPETGTVTV
jgi:hypothetical protein